MLAEAKLCITTQVMACDLAQFEPQNLARSSLEIREANMSDIAILEAVLKSDGNPVFKSLDPIFGSLQHENSRVIVASWDSEPAAFSVLTRAGSIAYLSNALTKPEFRGLGIQKAMIKYRNQLAHEMGCRMTLVETYRQFGVSYRNLLACGFCDVFSREIYRYEFDSQIRGSLEHSTEGHEFISATSTL